MAKGEATVEELVAKIQRGELRLPEMQRQYVWRAARVRDLLDSLYRSYPSGAILLWETSEDVPERAFSVSQQAPTIQSNLLLLDGQQRLTSLSAVTRGEPVSVRGRKKPIDLLFNLDHPDELSVVTEVEEELDEDDDEPDGVEAPDSDKDEFLTRFQDKTFVVATKRLEQDPRWVKVTDVFKKDGDGTILKRAGVTGLDDPRYEKYCARLAKLRAVRKYVYRMDILERNLSYTEVTEIFVRVNSLGAKLRSSDLALAQITAKWRGALAEFLAFQNKCEDDGYPLDLGLHLKNLVAFATGQSRFGAVAGLSVDALKAAWKNSTLAMSFAIDFLRSNARIDSPALLSSPFLLVATAYLAHHRDFKFSHDEAKNLRRWILLANAKGRYSRGSTETVLDQDLNAIRQGAKPDELIDRLRSQVGRLEIAPEELEGRNQRSALFKTMFLAFRQDDAVDWETKVVLSLGHAGAQNKLEFHHVFPKAVLRDRYSVREIDDIANLAFIGSKTNKYISDKKPATYFAKYLDSQGTTVFDRQCIPTDAGLLELDAYKSFLVERRRRIAARLNLFLDVAPS